MSKQEPNYAWLGWAIAGIVLIFLFISSDNDDGVKSNSASTTKPSSANTLTTMPNTTQETTSEPNTAWRCSDATSYNQNAYDDNKCTNGTEVRYVSDSEAKTLDPNYSPGKAGASYYNNQ